MSPRGSSVCPTDIVVARKVLEARFYYVKNKSINQRSVAMFLCARLPKKGNPGSRSSLKAMETDAKEGRDMIATDLHVLVVSVQGSKYTADLTHSRDCPWPRLLHAIYLQN